MPQGAQEHGAPRRGIVAGQRVHSLTPGMKTGLSQAANTRLHKPIAIRKRRMPQITSTRGTVVERSLWITQKQRCEWQEWQPKAVKSSVTTVSQKVEYTCIAAWVGLGEVGIGWGRRQTGLRKP